MKFNWYEAAGGIADVGVLLPIAVSLVAINNVNPVAALLVPAVFYIVSGVYYKLPIPVQPLKVFCAIAISVKASPELIAAGSFLIGIIFLLLSAPSIMNAVRKLFPTPIIRGIQLGTGLLLIEAGIGLFNNPKVLISGPHIAVNILNINLNMSLIIGIFAGALFLQMIRSTNKYPVSLVLIAVGIAVAGLCGGGLTADTAGDSSGAIKPMLDVKNFWQALGLLVLPQIPLSVGNAIIATNNTLKQYYGEKAVKASSSRLAFGMGCANIFAGLVGGMPCCHGSGGVTAHYKLGARTGGATILAGCFYAGLAFLTIAYGLSVFNFFPYPILGILLIYVGIEHSMLIRDVGKKADLAVVMIVASLAMATKNMTLAFLVGMIIYAHQQWSDTQLSVNRTKSDK